MLNLIFCKLYYKKQLDEHLKTNQVNRQQTIVIHYHQDVLKMP